MKRHAARELRHSSKPNKTKQKSMLLLVAASPLLLSSCASAPTTKAFCPIPIYPDKCAISWYERAETPPCFDDFMDRYMRQQQSIETNCGK